MKDELQHPALNRGVQKKRQLWIEAGRKLLRDLPLDGWASCRREDLMGLLAMLEQQVSESTRHLIEASGWKNSQNRVCADERNGSTANSTSYYLCAGRPGKHYWPRAGNIRRVDGYGRFPAWARFGWPF